LETGDLWAGDVGQNSVEEINIIERGKNYGWNIMEGSQCFNPPANCDTTGLETPVYEYLHPLGRSITGGYVYRGSELPLLEGAYIYGDFVSGYIWALWYLDGEVRANYILAETNLNISSFGIDENNELYLTAFNGKIYRLAYYANQ
jgi:glucose/arabinose dehydrogenase